MIKSINIQLDTADKNSKEYIHLNCNNLEASFKYQNDQLIERINSAKLENGKYSFDLMNVSNDLKKELDKVCKFKEEIYTKFEQEVLKMTDANKNTISSHDFLKSEFKIMKKKFTELSEFIKVMIV